jgi:hypothetical protein
MRSLRLVLTDCPALSRSKALVFVIGLGVIGWSPAQATSQPPPDFSSNGVAWTVGPAYADLIAVRGSPSPVTPDPAHPYVNNLGLLQGKQTTFRIGDISNPNLKPWARELMKKDNDEVFAGKIAFSPRASCTASGVPAYMLQGGGNTFFLQTPKEVIIIFDADAQVRRIYMDVPHSERVKPSWYGESVGHYEGDTLVIDTIGMNTKTFLDGYRTPHTEKLHIIERWKKFDEGKGLEVTITVDDPDTFNQPWQALVRYRRVSEPWQEQVCAENNQVLFDYHIPIDNEPDF